MSDAKAEILDRIRSALRDNPQPPAIQRDYRRHSSMGAEERCELLTDRLVDYKAQVHRATEDTVARTIADLLGDNAQYVVPRGLPDSWLPADTASRRRFVDSGNAERSGALSNRELDAMDAVVTSSTVSCAETGTVFLNTNDDEGRRAISLVPDHHICVVRTDTVVELFPEALARVDRDRPITMFSGPSATSDIELQRVEGVHGPRRLDVIILD